MNSIVRIVLFVSITILPLRSQITVGYNNPGTMSNTAGVGTLVWQNPTNAQTSNNVRTSTIPGQTGVTNYLSTTNYNFVLPAPCPSCIVTGVTTSIERRAQTQPDVAILNNWQSLNKTGPGYNFPVTNSNPPAIMNRALVVVIGLENGPRPLLNGGPINPPTPGNDSRDITSVTYGGVPMIQACEVTYSSILSGTAFWARNEIWFLNDAGIAAATNNQIVITNPGNSYEYYEMVSAVSFQNVDQLAPIFASRIDTVVGDVNPFALGYPAPMLQGSCAVTSVVCGNPGTYVFNNGGSSGIPGVNFVLGTNQNGSSSGLTYASSTPTMMTGHAIVPDGFSGSVAPTYQFSATPNRQVISMICVQRARDFDNEVRLIRNGVITGNNLSLSTTYPKQDGIQTYGGANNMWGTTLSLAQVTANNFGFALSSRVQNRQIEVDHMTMRIHLQSTLPVELVNFEGERIDREIQLTWSTASETNNDHFELHRSEDAINYQLINTINGAGNSNNLLSYIYNDMDAKHDIVNYYKIKQVDFNGESEWYGPIMVEAGEVENSLTLYPNPATTTVHITNMETIDNYSIFNGNGQIVKSGKMENGQVNIDELIPGAYYISIGDSGEKIKFLKF